jgi:hypothetical protein
VAYYGIQKSDIPAVKAMLRDQPLIADGRIDVTKPPFNADPGGAKDVTKAINEAIYFARHHKLAVWFPAGRYRVSDTLGAVSGWFDERSFKLLPYSEVWPCVLMGPSEGGRAVLVLDNNAPGFSDPRKPKTVLQFGARVYNNPSEARKRTDNGAAVLYNSMLRNIDIEIGTGNPGAIALDLRGAEGSNVQDCTLRVGDGYAGFMGGLGSGGYQCGVTIEGGRFGMIAQPRETPVLVGFHFIDQSECALTYSDRGALSAVGCSFKSRHPIPFIQHHDGTGVNPDAQRRALPKRAGGLGQVAVFDSVLEYTGGNALKTPAIESNAPLYLRNCFFRGAGSLVRSAFHGQAIGTAGDGWARAVEVALPHDYGRVKPSGKMHPDLLGKVPESFPQAAYVYLNGERSAAPYVRLEEGAPAPDREALFAAHHPGAGLIPGPDATGLVNARKPPYSAKGDGSTDDYAALQRAIDENEKVFLPKGAYRVSQPLRLKPETQLIGLHNAYTLIAPLAGEGSFFTDPAHPQPVIVSSDSSDAHNRVAFINLFVPTEIARGSYALDWQAGGDSVLLSVNPMTGYMATEKEPLEKGIYPWSDWSWAQFSFGDREFVIATHYLLSSRTPAPDIFEDRRRNWPLVSLSGKAALRWFGYYHRGSWNHGQRYRQIDIQDAQGPIRFYHTQLQYACGDYEVTIRNSAQVSLFGIKNERYGSFLVENSRDVLISGIGGVPRFREGWPKVELIESASVRVVCFASDYLAKEPGDPMPGECRWIGETWQGKPSGTKPLEQPVLYLREEGQMEGE